MKPTSKCQLESAPLQINKAAVHFRIKTQKRPISRARSAPKEFRREAGTSVSPRLYEEFLNLEPEIFQKENKKLPEFSIAEMPSHLEESPRKQFVKVLHSKNFVNITPCKKKKVKPTTPVKKARRIHSKINFHYITTPKSKHTPMKYID